MLPKLFVVVPVLNEVLNMPRLLGDLKKLSTAVSGEFGVQVLLIDDGSQDGTSESAQKLAENLPLSVISHSQTRGPGAAFATAFAALAPQLQESDWVVTMEGDNTSRIETLSQMLVRRREGFGVVLASPYAYGGGITNTSFLRVFLSHIANTLVKEFLGIRGILTMSSFFRLLSAPTILKLQRAYGPGILDSTGFECMVELLSKLIRQGAKISEVAMNVDTSRRQGKSKMRIWRTILGYLRLIFLAPKWAKDPELLPAARPIEKLEP